MSDHFDFRTLEKLENFMSLKRGISNPDIEKLEQMLYPNGATMSVTLDDVAALESRLNVVVPVLYRKFLLEYGYASWFGGAVYGITPDGCTEPSLDLSVLSLTEEVRSNLHPEPLTQANHSFVIDTDDAGGFLLMTSTADDLAGRVDLWVHEDGWKIAQSWSSFAEYLADIVRRANDQYADD